MAIHRLLLTGVTLSLLSGCGTVGTGLTSPLTTSALGADDLGGLATAVAAHASVEAARPAAFVLVSQAASFLAATARVVAPLRQNVAAALQADAKVSQGLANWDTSTSASRMATLKQVAALECQVMGCSLPAVVESKSAPTQDGMLAYFQPASTGPGQVTLYPTAFATGGAYLALATVVHEVRHAAQYQLVLADEANSSLLTADQRTLALAYSGAWQAMDAWGGESALSYGDYAHLAVEFDAFQTGNAVAAVVSGGRFDASGSGFVDARFDATGAPALDVAKVVAQNLTAVQLVGAINVAEALAEQPSSRGSAGRGQVRHGAPSRDFGAGRVLRGALGQLAAAAGG